MVTNAGLRLLETTKSDTSDQKETPTARLQGSTRMFQPLAMPYAGITAGGDHVDELSSLTTSIRMSR
jgi:hypothetical protein